MSYPINQEIEALRAEIARLTEEIDALKVAAYDATHDDLTGLHNNRWLRQYWDSLGEAPERKISGVLMIDGDGVKRVNDRYGHDAGDNVIRHLANSMRHRGCPAIRRGGDEFLVLIPAGFDPLLMAKLILTASRRPLSVRGGDVSVTISIGIALVADQNEMRLSNLINGADSAMYRAKGLGGDCIEIF